MRRGTDGRRSGGGVVGEGLRALVTVGYMFGATMAPVAAAYAVDEVVECGCKCHSEEHKCECEPGQCRCFELGHDCECDKCKAAREAAGHGDSGLPGEGEGQDGENLGDDGPSDPEPVGTEGAPEDDVPGGDGPDGPVVTIDDPDGGDSGQDGDVVVVTPGDGGQDGNEAPVKPDQADAGVVAPSEVPANDGAGTKSDPVPVEEAEPVAAVDEVVVQEATGEGVTGSQKPDKSSGAKSGRSSSSNKGVAGAHLGADALPGLTQDGADVVDGERPDDVVAGETPLSDVFGVGTYTPHATGSYVSDPDSVRDRYARRIYSAFHTLGLSDEQIAGILSNLQSECNIDPTTIEGIYDEPFSVSGKRKASASASRDALSQWTLQLLTTEWPKGYGGTLGSDGHVSGAHVGSEYGVASDFYGPGTDGRFYPGIGIGSWTGQAQVSSVLDGADKLGVRWFDIDYQIAAMMAYPGNGSDGLGIYDEYMSACAGKSATECASWFLAHWEGCPGVREASHVATAEEWLARIHGEKWSSDVASGARGLSLAARLGVDFGDDAKRIEDVLEDVTVTSVSSLADALVSYSYSKAPSLSDGYAGTKRYADVWSQVAPGDDYFRSCDRGVACAIRWCGLDDAFPLGSCETQWMHCMSHPETWAYVGDFQAHATGAAGEAEALAAGLQPGDILITQANLHTMAFVGSDTVSRVYAAEVRGTDGDLGEPDAGAAWVSGSIGVDGAASTWSTGPGSGRAPGVGVGGDACSHTYSVFRYTGEAVVAPAVGGTPSSNAKSATDGATDAVRSSDGDVTVVPKTVVDGSSAVSDPGVRPSDDATKPSDDMVKSSDGAAKPVIGDAAVGSDAADTRSAVDGGDDVAKRASAAVGAEYDVCDHAVGDDASKSSFSTSGLVDYALGREAGASSIDSIVKEVRLSDGARLSVSDVKPGDVVVTADGLCVAVGDGKAVGAVSGEGVVKLDLSQEKFVEAAPLLS